MVSTLLLITSAVVRMICVTFPPPLLAMFKIAENCSISSMPLRSARSLINSSSVIFVSFLCGSVQFPVHGGMLTIQHSYILPAFKSIFQRISASQRICHRQDAFLELHGQFLSVLPTLSVDAPAKIEKSQREQ